MSRVLLLENSIFLILVSVALCISITRPAMSNPSEAKITAIWHIRVADHDLNARILPLIPPADGPLQLTDVSPANEAACLDQVEAAYSVYPPALISRLVSILVLADDITAQSIRGGGFQTSGIMAVNCDSAQTAAGAAFDEDTVHNDLAGLLLTVGRVDLRPWRTLNSSGFAYGNMDSVKAELLDPDGRFGDVELYSHGFVSRLGVTDATNDFDTFAGQMFGHPAETVDLLHRYPALRGKARLLISTYENASPAIKTYFDQSGLTAAAGG